MKADFSGYATKAGLKCSDGRTIMPEAFSHQDQVRVPLVWQHGHNDPENVLGHAILEARPDGVYAYCHFNDSQKAQHARKLVHHKDINMLSIWANNLIERAGKVLHGTIREVSLVLSGANPGALIDNVTIRHSDGDDHVLEDEAIIYTGLEIDSSISHADKNEDDDEDGETIEDIYNSMSDKQKNVLHYMIGEALSDSSDKMEQSAVNDDDIGDTVEEIYNSLTDKQKNVLHLMVGEAVADAEASIKQDNINSDDFDTEGYHKMTRNVFEKNDPTPVLSHSDIQGIVADAMKNGSLKDAVENYALQHNITNIDLLFPEARAISEVPEFLKRRTEWVAGLLGSTRKSPFSRIKTLVADLTYEDARAKGYVKGALKKEEFFAVLRRITTPTTIYKKQKLERDDMIDITDFDVVAWLKGEMRLMLDEELARAILIGDGRDVSHEDKINEGNIRPVAKDHELYTTTVNVNIDDANSSIQEVIDALVTHRHYYRGTGLPTMYTSEMWIAKFLLLKDSTGRRIYKSLDELAAELRVAAVVSVEVLEETPDIIGIIFNPIDYVVGADKGGAVNMFDDFDIDYNQHKYLIETRVCGALVKPKSAMVVKKVAVSLVMVTPQIPTFVSNTGVVTIPNQTGVVYKNAAGDTLTAGAQSAIAAGASIVINAFPATGYFFPTTEDDSWTFTRESV